MQAVFKPGIWLVQVVSSSPLGSEILGGPTFFSPSPIYSYQLSTT
jgi:hypothetical protein